MKQSAYSWSSLGKFITELESRGELKRIKQQVDPYLEITSLAEPLMKQGGPALLFENVKGSSFPLLINMFGSSKRMALALGQDSLEGLSGRFRELMEFDLPANLLAKLALALPKLKSVASFAPRLVSDAPCQEIVLKGGEASLSQLPVLTCWPGDAGPFITLPLVISADPANGRQNWGMYRMQVYDQQTTGMHWHSHKGGAAHYRAAGQQGVKLPVAVALGGPPAVIYAACAPWPEPLDEAMLAGFLMNKPIPLVKAVTSDLLVPAEAEFILEGYVDPAEPLRREGPFGDHTGFYSLADDYPVFHLTALTRRKNPVYPATVVGIPPMEDYYLGQATERLFLPLLQMLIPEIHDYHLPAEGVFHNLVFVAIKKQYPGQAYKVMNALWGQGQMMFAKVIVVVDHDVDVQNPQQAWWEALSNFDPAHDLLLSKGPADALDHAARKPGQHGKLGLDCTRKLPEEGYQYAWPQRVALPLHMRQAALAKLRSWGLIA